MAGRGILGRMRGRVNGQRAAMPLPVPQVGDGGTAGTAPGRPFDHRVRVLVEIRDEPDEIALAEELVGGLGWPLREPREGEGPVDGPTPSHVARVVEVRLPGARRGAAAQATYELVNLARRTGLHLFVREAALIRRPAGLVQNWEVVPVRLSLRDRFQLLWDSDSLDWPERYVRVDEGEGDATADRPPIVERLDPEPFDHARFELRPVDPVRADRLLVWLAVFGFLIWAALFTALYFFDALKREHPQLADLGLALSLSMAASMGFLGLQHSLRYSSTVRHALPWVLPLAVPLLLAGVPKIGDFVHNRYLSHFDLPDGGMATDWENSLGAGLPVTLFGLAGLALGVGTAGIIHRSGARIGVPFAAAITFGLVFGFFAAVPLGTASVHRADIAAENAQRALVSGRAPAEYFGLEPDFVCIRPTTGTPAVYGPLPPPTRPVVTFGPQGDRISLWDPKTKRSLSMRLEDASFVPARFEHGRARCPQAR